MSERANIESPGVAFLGTGIMGAAMARNLTKAGHALRVWNRTRARAEPLAQDGAQVMDSAAQAAEGAGVVITMLAHGPAVAEVMTGTGNVLSQMQPGSVWIQMSTVGVDETERFAESAAAAGVSYLDAPVLGTKQPAESGTLVIMAAGPAEARERCDPLFDAMGQRTLGFEQVGHATRLKLVANHWVTALLGILAQNIAFARAIGVNPADFLALIQGGPLDVGYAQIKGKAMISGELEPSFPLYLARKDVGLILSAAARSGLDLPMTSALEGLFATAEDRGHGAEDMAAVIRGLGPTA